MADFDLFVKDAEGTGADKELLVKDVTDVVLNLKEVRLRLNSTVPKEITDSKKGPGPLLALASNETS